MDRLDKTEKPRRESEVTVVNIGPEERMFDVDTVSESESGGEAESAYRLSPLMVRTRNTPAFPIQRHLANADLRGKHARARVTWKRIFEVPRGVLTVEGCERVEKAVQQLNRDVGYMIDSLE